YPKFCAKLLAFLIFLWYNILKVITFMRGQKIERVYFKNKKLKTLLAGITALCLCAGNFQTIGQV
ncbi:MAG: hypothetical protein K2K06_08270, partial [Oscillospiraceae bacterium]|nr:hypothetical protein [Oscillospiraceae bacterium]